MRHTFKYTLRDLIRNREQPLVTCMGCGRRRVIPIAKIAERLRDPESVTVSALLLRLRCSQCGGFADPAYKLVRMD